jgi:hypothetical protein
MKTPGAPRGAVFIFLLLVIGDVFDAQLFSTTGFQRVEGTRSATADETVTRPIDSQDACPLEPIQPYTHQQPHSDEFNRTNKFVTTWLFYIHTSTTT